MKSNILFLIVFLSSLSFAQREWDRWDKTDDPYLFQIGNAEEERSGGSILLKPFIYLYWILISEQDGDNCPFHPSCSHFFLKAVEETNIIQGTFMFADRFTRDMNFFGRRENYPIIKNRRLYDPPQLYTLRNVSYPPTR
jgi:putative component of membrane protein insertase Oxa1/YidC/SpoIIIJ protein YidD